MVATNKAAGTALRDMELRGVGWWGVEGVLSGVEWCREEWMERRREERCEEGRGGVGGNWRGEARRRVGRDQPAWTGGKCSDGRGPLKSSVKRLERYGVEWRGGV